MNEEKVEIIGKSINDVTAQKIASQLRQDKIKILIIRECHLNEKVLWNILRGVSRTTRLVQLCLSVGILNSPSRVQILISCLSSNQSLSSLSIHGSYLGDSGMKVLVKSLREHPGITALDVGDCKLGDTAINYIKELLPDRENKRGLEYLVLSANASITAYGWTKLFMAISKGCCLQTLRIDFNPIGDNGLASLTVALSSYRKLEVLDLESTELGKLSGRLLLMLLQQRGHRLKKLILSGNNISPDVVEAIADLLHASSDTDAGLTSEWESPHNHSDADSGRASAAGSDTEERVHAKPVKIVVTAADNDKGHSEPEMETLKQTESFGIPLLWPNYPDK